MKKLNQLRFADEIVLTADSVAEAQDMLKILNAASVVVGLKLNRSKTQFMTNMAVSEGI